MVVSFSSAATCTFQCQSSFSCWSLPWTLSSGSRGSRWCFSSGTSRSGIGSPRTYSAVSTLRAPYRVTYRISHRSTRKRCCSISKTRWWKGSSRANLTCKVEMTCRNWRVDSSTKRRSTRKRKEKNMMVSEKRADRITRTMIRSRTMRLLHSRRKATSISIEQLTSPSIRIRGIRLITDQAMILIWLKTLLTKEQRNNMILFLRHPKRRRIKQGTKRIVRQWRPGISLKMMNIVSKTTIMMPKTKGKLSQSKKNKMGSSKLWTFGSKLKTLNLLQRMLRIHCNNTRNFQMRARILLMTVSLSSHLSILILRKRAMTSTKLRSRGSIKSKRKVECNLTRQVNRTKEGM